MEDLTSKCVKPFAFTEATAEEFGTPRKIIANNVVQFISDIKSKAM